jgi:hypothetical protein
MGSVDALILVGAFSGNQYFFDRIWVWMSRLFEFLPVYVVTMNAEYVPHAFA